MLSPTGSLNVRMDGWGSGRFGASRDGGGRVHVGLDLRTYEGQRIIAPMDGTIRLGLAYSDDAYQIVDVIGDGLRVRLFYVRALVDAGVRVAAGRVIGEAQDVGDRYNGRPEVEELGVMLPHVHMEVIVQAGHAAVNRKLNKRGIRVDPFPLLEVRRV